VSDPLPLKRKDATDGDLLPPAGISPETGKFVERLRVVEEARRKLGNERCGGVGNSSETRGQANRSPEIGPGMKKSHKQGAMAKAEGEKLGSRSSEGARNASPYCWEKVETRTVI